MIKPFSPLTDKDVPQKVSTMCHDGVDAVSSLRHVSHTPKDRRALAL